MKTLVRFFIASVLLVAAGHTAHAQLTASAGPDVILCAAGLSGFPVDTPSVGGTPAATGGTAPYTYLWTVTDMMYPASYYLSDVTAPNPELIAAGEPGAAITTVLRVTDAAGAVAYDTTVMRFQSLICLGAECVLFKDADDTLTLSQYCFDSFAPITFEWTPSAGLSDPTIATPKAFNSTSQTYTCIATDAYGCQYRGAMCSITVSGVGIGPEVAPVAPLIFAGTDGYIHTVLPAGVAAAMLTVADVTGRVLLQQRIAAGSATIPVAGKVAAGVYYYRVAGADGGLYTGKLLLQ